MDKQFNVLLNTQRKISVPNTVNFLETHKNDGLPIILDTPPVDTIIELIKHSPEGPNEVLFKLITILNNQYDEIYNEKTTTRTGEEDLQVKRMLRTLTKEYNDIPTKNRAKIDAEKIKKFAKDIHDILNIFNENTSNTLDTEKARLGLLN